MSQEPVIPAEETEFPDVPGEGMFRALELDEEQADARAAEQELTREEANEWGRQANYRARQLAAENQELRARLGIEPGAPIGGVETGEGAASEAQYGNVDDTYASAQNLADPVNDLVQEAPRVSRDELRDLVREVVKELLPRPRAITVFIPGEGQARVPADEVVARTYSALVDTVAQLAARATRVPVEDGLWSMGVEDETASLMAQVAMASPRRPKSVSHSRSV